MTKQEQIEQMAKVMCGGCGSGKECMKGLCADWYRAEKLHNANCRKLPEGSVVLSKEEYNDLILAKKTFASDGEEVSSDMLLSTFRGIKEQARKETAKEIIDMLIPNCEVCDENWHKGCLCLRAMIAEKIVKQFGVEVEK